jgi:hypothetical protein
MNPPIPYGLRGKFQGPWIFEQTKAGEEIFTGLARLGMDPPALAFVARFTSAGL